MQPYKGTVDINGKIINWQTTFDQSIKFKCIRCGLSCIGADVQLTEKEIVLAKTEIIGALKEMEQRLQNPKSEFLFADQYTMADSVGATRLFRLQLLGFEKEMRQYPLTFAYYGRMQQRPSFAAIK